MSVTVSVIDDHFDDHRKGEAPNRSRMLKIVFALGKVNRFGVVVPTTV